MGDPARPLTIWSVQPRATPASSPDTWSWRRPFDARRLLIAAARTAPPVAPGPPRAAARLARSAAARDRAWAAAGRIARRPGRRRRRHGERPPAAGSAGDERTSPGHDRERTRRPTLSAGRTPVGSASARGRLCWTAAREPGHDHRPPPRRRRRADLPRRAHHLRRAPRAGRPACAAACSASASSPATGSASWPPTTGTSSCPTSRCWAPACVAVPLNPTQPRARGRARAGRHRGPRRDRRARPAAGGRRRARPRRALPAPRARDRQRGRRPRRRRPARRPARRRRRRPSSTASADDLAVLMFTSGTAGSPKAAMLTHGNLLANLEQCQAHPGRSQGADDVVFGVLPLFHIFGLNVVLGLSLVAGAARAAGRAVRPAVRPRGHRAATASPSSAARPTMWAAWAALPGTRPGALPTVRLATSGAAKLDPQVRRGDRGPLRRRRHRGLRAHRGLARRHVRHRARRARGQHRRAAPRASRSAWSTPTARTRSSATPASSGCRAPTCSPATGTTPRPPRRAHDRRLAAHRRRRGGRRRRLPVPRRPGQGPHHRVGVQRVPGRGRGGARRAPRRRRRSPSSACPTRTRARRSRPTSSSRRGASVEEDDIIQPLRGAPRPLQVPAESKPCLTFYVEERGLSVIAGTRGDARRVVKGAISCRRPAFKVAVLNRTGYFARPVFAVGFAFDGVVELAAERRYRRS